MKYGLSQFILDSQASFNSSELTNGHHSKWISTLIFSSCLNYINTHCLSLMSSRILC